MKKLYVIALIILLASLLLASLPASTASQPASELEAKIYIPIVENPGCFWPLWEPPAPCKQ